MPHDAIPAPDCVEAPLLLHVFPSFEVGGAQVRFTTLANHFGTRYRHAVIAMDNRHGARTRLDPSLDVKFPLFTPTRGDSLRTIRSAWRLLRKLRPARLVTSNWGSIEWALANRAGLVPHLHTEDGFGPDERARQLPRRVWTRRVALAGHPVAVPSRTLQRIATETWRLPPRHVHYVPNGVDLARFTPGSPRPRTPSVIGTVAVLRTEKNVARLLQAFALLPPGTARLLVIGDGPERATLEALASALGIAADVEWAGYIRDPAPLFHTMDIFALSSDTEQMPLSLLEAMAAGLPAACTDVGDVASILPVDQRPYIVPLDDDALAHALRTLAADPALRTRLGAANRARAAAEFDQSAMFAAWDSLYAGR